jgi:hypothetical protein
VALVRVPGAGNDSADGGHIALFEQFLKLLSDLAARGYAIVTKVS